MICNLKKKKIIISKIIRIKNPFLILEDYTGKIQFYSKKKFNLGDIIFSLCFLKKTKKKIFYFIPLYFKLVSKNILYFDKKLLIKKTFSIKNFIKKYLLNFFFLNVNTNILCLRKSNSFSNIFKTFNFNLKKFLYLKISPELEIKKILSLNFDRIFEISYCFRNEGISCIHNYEFNILEYYSKNLNFKNSIFFLELFIKNIFKVYKNYFFNLFNLNFSFLTFIKKISIIEIILLFLKNKNILYIFFFKKIFFKYLKIKNILCLKSYFLYDLIFKIFNFFIQKKIIFPIFIKKYPSKISSLSLPIFTNLNFVSRFELFFLSIEISNGFEELNDYFLQKKNLKNTNKDFLIYLKNCLFNLNGVGIGINRIFLFLLRVSNVKKIYEL